MEEAAKISGTVMLVVSSVIGFVSCILMVWGGFVGKGGKAGLRKRWEVCSNKMKVE